VGPLLRGTPSAVENRPRQEVFQPPVTDRSDVIVVGAGILGLAVARELLSRNPRRAVTVLEKEREIALHQTGHNSGVIHSGVYYAPGSLKARLCVAGSRSMYEYCRERGIAARRSGKVIVAHDDSELPRLDGLYERGLANGVEGIEKITAARLAEIEPHARGVAALHLPAAGIVDFKSVARSFASDIAHMEGRIVLGEAVVSITTSETHVDVVTGSGRRRRARWLVSCAGLHSDRLAAMTGVSRVPKIIPFRGTYYRVRGEGREFVKSLIYPIPDPAFPFLGVHLTAEISGGLLAGPNAFLAFSREGYQLTDFSLSEFREILAYPGFRSFVRRHWRRGLDEAHSEFSRRNFLRLVRRLVPDLSREHLHHRHSGVRAQLLAVDGALVDDFHFDRAHRVVHVRNAPSPSATSSLALASKIVNELEHSSGFPH
jgi:L-2-hydroxyglutarate oxidase